MRELYALKMILCQEFLPCNHIRVNGGLIKLAGFTEAT